MLMRILLTLLWPNWIVDCGLELPDSFYGNWQLESLPISVHHMQYELRAWAAQEPRFA